MQYRDITAWSHGESCRMTVAVCTLLLCKILSRHNIINGVLRYALY